MYNFLEALQEQEEVQPLPPEPSLSAGSLLHSISSGLLAGFTGFEILDNEEERDTTYEGIAYGIGHILGLTGMFASVIGTGGMTAIGRGSLSIGSKLIGRAAVNSVGTKGVKRLVGESLTSASGSVFRGQQFLRDKHFTSVPEAVTKWALKDADGTLRAIPRLASEYGSKLGVKLGLKEEIAANIIDRSIHMGTVMGIASVPIDVNNLGGLTDPAVWQERLHAFGSGMVFGAVDAGIANFFSKEGFAMVGKGITSPQTKIGWDPASLVKRGESGQYKILGIDPSKVIPGSDVDKYMRAGVRALALGTFQTMHGRAEDTPTEIDVYNALLGGVFGWMGRTKYDMDAEAYLRARNFGTNALSLGKILDEVNLAKKDNTSTFAKLDPAVQERVSGFLYSAIGKAIQLGDQVSTGVETKLRTMTEGGATMTELFKEIIELKDGSWEGTLEKAEAFKKKWNMSDQEYQSWITSLAIRKSNIDTSENLHTSLEMLDKLTGGSNEHIDEILKSASQKMSVANNRQIVIKAHEASINSVEHYLNESGVVQLREQYQTLMSEGEFGGSLEYPLISLAKATLEYSGLTNDVEHLKVIWKEFSDSFNKVKSDNKDNALTLNKYEYSKKIKTESFQTALREIEKRLSKLAPDKTKFKEEFDKAVLRITPTIDYISQSKIISQLYLEYNNETKKYSIGDLGTMGKDGKYIGKAGVETQLEKITGKELHILNTAESDGKFKNGMNKKLDSIQDNEFPFIELLVSSFKTKEGKSLAFLGGNKDKDQLLFMEWVIDPNDVDLNVKFDAKLKEIDEAIREVNKKVKSEKDEKVSGRIDKLISNYFALEEGIAVATSKVNSIGKNLDSYQSPSKERDAVLEKLLKAKKELDKKSEVFNNISNSIHKDNSSVEIYYKFLSKEFEHYAYKTGVASTELAAQVYKATVLNLFEVSKLRNNMDVVDQIKSGGDFIFDALKYNKRNQIYVASELTIDNKYYDGIEGLKFEQGKSPEMNLIIVSDINQNFLSRIEGQHDPTSKVRTPEDIVIEKAEGRGTDGAVYLRQDIYDARLKGIGGWESSSAIKGSAISGALVIKKGEFRAGDLLNKALKDHNLHGIMYKSSIKQIGTEQVYDWQMKRNGSIEFYKVGSQDIESKPELWQKVEKFTYNQGVRDEQKNLFKDSKIPMPLLSSISDQSILKHFNELFYIPSFNGTDASRAIVGELHREIKILSNNKSGVVKENSLGRLNEAVKLVKVEELSIQDIYEIINGPLSDIPELYNKVVQHVIDLKVDMMDNPLLVESIFKNEVGARAFLDNLGVSKVSTSLSTTNAWVNDKLRRFILQKITNPTMENSSKGPMLPYGAEERFVAIEQTGADLDVGSVLISMDLAKQMKTVDGEFYVDVIARNQALRGEPTGAAQKDTKYPTMLAIRVPAPGASAVRNLKVVGIHGHKGTGVVYHPEDMFYMHGADVDFDTAFNFWSFPEALKGEYIKNSKIFHDTEGAARDLFTIDLTPEWWTSKDDALYRNKFSGFSPFHLLMANRFANSGSKQVGSSNLTKQRINFLYDIPFEGASGEIDPLLLGKIRKIEKRTGEGMLPEGHAFTWKRRLTNNPSEPGKLSSQERFNEIAMDAMTKAIDAANGIPIGSISDTKSKLHDAAFEGIEIFDSKGIAIELSSEAMKYLNKNVGIETDVFIRELVRLDKLLSSRVTVTKFKERYNKETDEMVKIPFQFSRQLTPVEMILLAKDINANLVVLAKKFNIFPVGKDGIVEIPSGRWSNIIQLAKINLHGEALFNPAGESIGLIKRHWDKIFRKLETTEKDKALDIAMKVFRYSVRIGGSPSPNLTEYIDKGVVRLEDLVDVYSPKQISEIFDTLTPRGSEQSKIANESYLEHSKANQMIAQDIYDFASFNLVYTYAEKAIANGISQERLMQLAQTASEYKDSFSSDPEVLEKNKRIYVSAKEKSSEMFNEMNKFRLSLSPEESAFFDAHLISSLYPQLAEVDGEISLLTLKQAIKTNKLKSEDILYNFKGFHGGFGKGNVGGPIGSNADVAMRKIATDFIGEIVQEKSSSATSRDMIKEKGPLIEGQKNIIMLARNGSQVKESFYGKELMESTKQNILDAHKAGAEFIVGDMQNVDTQFIDYLKSINATFSIYGVNKSSRIKLPNKNLEEFNDPKTLKELGVNRVESRSKEEVDSATKYWYRTNVNKLAYTFGKLNREVMNNFAKYLNEVSDFSRKPQHEVTIDSLKEIIVPLKKQTESVESSVKLESIKKEMPEVTEIVPNIDNIRDRVEEFAQQLNFNKEALIKRINEEKAYLRNAIKENRIKKVNSLEELSIQLDKYKKDNPEYALSDEFKKLKDELTSVIIDNPFLLSEFEQYFAGMNSALLQSKAGRFLDLSPGGPSISLASKNDLVKFIEYFKGIKERQKNPLPFSQKNFFKFTQQIGSELTDSDPVFSIFERGIVITPEGPIESPMRVFKSSLGFMADYWAAVHKSYSVQEASHSTELIKKTSFLRILEQKDAEFLVKYSIRLLETGLVDNAMFENHKDFYNGRFKDVSEEFEKNFKNRVFESPLSSKDPITGEVLVKEITKVMKEINNTFYSKHIKGDGKAKLKYFVFDREGHLDVLETLRNISHDVENGKEIGLSIDDYKVISHEIQLNKLSFEVYDQEGRPIEIVKVGDLKGTERTSAIDHLRGKGFKVDFDAINWTQERVDGYFPHTMFDKKISLKKEKEKLHMMFQRGAKQDTLDKIHLKNLADKLAGEDIEHNLVGDLQQILEAESPLITQEQIEKSGQLFTTGNLQRRGEEGKAILEGYNETFDAYNHYSQKILKAKTNLLGTLLSHLSIESFKQNSSYFSGTKEKVDPLAPKSIKSSEMTEGEKWTNFMILFNRANVGYPSIFPESWWKGGDFIHKFNPYRFYTDHFWLRNLEKISKKVFNNQSFLQNVDKVKGENYKVSPTQFFENEEGGERKVLSESELIISINHRGKNSGKRTLNLHDELRDRELSSLMQGGVQKRFLPIEYSSLGYSSKIFSTIVESAKSIVEKTGKKEISLGFVSKTPTWFKESNQYGADLNMMKFMRSLSKALKEEGISIKNVFSEGNLGIEEAVIKSSSLFGIDNKVFIEHSHRLAAGPQYKESLKRRFIGENGLDLMAQEEKANLEFINRERAVRLNKLLRGAAMLEGKWEMLSLLAHPKYLLANMIGATHNDIAYSGLKPRSKANYKWLSKYVDPTMSHKDDWTKFAYSNGAIDSMFGEEFAAIEANHHPDKVKLFKQKISEILSEEGTNPLEKVKELTSSMNISGFALNAIKLSERIAREKSWFTHYVKARELFEAERIGLPKDHPWLILMANRGVAFTQYLYNNANRPLYMTTPLGTLFTRFQSYMWNSIALRNKVYKDAKEYGFQEGTEQGDRFKRFVIADMFALGLATVFPMSIFQSSLPPPYDYLKNMAQAVYGEDKKKRPGYGVYSLDFPFNTVQPIIPPSSRLLGPFLALGMRDMDQISSYMIYSLFPYGLLARDAIRTIQNPTMMGENLLRIPFHAMHYKLKNRDTKEEGEDMANDEFVAPQLINLELDNLH